LVTFLKKLQYHRYIKFFTNLLKYRFSPFSQGDYIRTAPTPEIGILGAAIDPLAL
jgi:hypothetical protein